MEYSNAGRAVGGVSPSSSVSSGTSEVLAPERADRGGFARILSQTAKDIGLGAPPAGVAPLAGEAPLAGVAPQTGGRLQNAVERGLEKFIGDWQRADGRTVKLIERLPAEVRPMMETQIMVNRLALDVQIITRAGETLGSTIRQVQQLGGR